MCGSPKGWGGGGRTWPVCPYAGSTYGNDFNIIIAQWRYVHWNDTIINNIPCACARGKVISCVINFVITVVVVVIVVLLSFNGVIASLFLLCLLLHSNS